jgi:hypothetical protein
MPDQPPTFHLGITMAGAVSAGCYTAGVMDYLFEVLDLWERAKNGDIAKIDAKSIPQHQVCIDAMGGTSAGGMATIMSALYALEGTINPVTEVPENPLESFNVLYDSWVHLDDDENGDTFSKMWETEDLDSGFQSVLNTQPIDQIAQRVFDRYPPTDLKTHIEHKLPKFISKDLEVLLAHAFLRGVPLAVDFKTEIARRLKTSPKHNTYEHFMMSHFKLNHGEGVDPKQALWLNPFEKEHAQRMKLSTLATGAFPIGLAYRKFDQSQFNDDYIKHTVKKIVHGDFGMEEPDVSEQIDFHNFPEQFETISVDGGAINNEPYREVESILKRKFEKRDVTYQNFGMVMIDPFPDNDDIKRTYTEPSDLVGLVPHLIKTLWNQSRVKRKEMLEQYDTNYFRGVIYPRKHITDAQGNYRFRDKNPLASAAFGAFGGFLDINFRVHDFFLGRNNAKNFIRFFGSFPYEPEKNNVHPIHKDWTAEMVNTFSIKRPGDPRVFLPIIPDMNILLKDGGTGDTRYHYDMPKKPKLDPTALIVLSPKIENRIRIILNLLINRKSNPQKEHGGDNAHQWLQKIEKNGWWSRLKGRIGRLLFRLAKKPALKSISNKSTELFYQTIFEELDALEQLQTREKSK